MQLKKIFRTYQSILISFTILMVCFVGIFVGVVPLVQKIIGLADDFRTISKRIAIMNSKVLVLQTIDENTLRSDLQTLLSAVPSDKSLPTLLATLDSVAAKTGVSVGSVSLMKPGSLSTASAERITSDEKSVGSSILPFTVSITGAFEQIRAFFTEAISVRRFFRIRSYTISFSPEGGIAVSISMDAFYSPIPVVIGSIEKPLTELSSADADVIAKVAGMQNMVPSVSALPPAAPGAGKSDPFSL